MKRRFLLDNDGSNIFHNRLAADTDLDAIVAETVRECAPEVTTYLLCSNAGTCYFPTKVGLMDPRATGLKAALERGQDLFGMLLRAIKSSGREAFVTMRMNDVHNPEDADAWNTPPLRRKHPDWVVGWDEIQAGKAQWMSYCLDYSRPEVQDYHLALIEEIAGMYGDVLDGFQLDWMRFPRHLPGTLDQVWERRDSLTQFTSEARRILRRSGRNLQLAARVPPTVQGCHHLGVDLAEWGRGHLVDFLVLCPFLTTNWEIPVHEFRSLLGCAAIPLYGGFDFGYGSSSHHPESLRGVCTSLYDCGADGIYLFNFPCWTEYLAARPYHWLKGLSDPARAAEKPLQFAVSHKRHRQLHTDGPGQLPATLPARSSLDLTIFVPPSSIPAWRSLLLVHSHGDVTVSVNGTSTTPLRFRADERSGSGGHRSEIFLEFVDQYWDRNARPKPQDCRLFSVPPAALKPGTNVITLIGQTAGDIEIERVKLALW